MDKGAFQWQLLESDLFDDSDIDINIYLASIVHVVSASLDRLTPLRTACRPQGKRSARWLSKEDIEAKELRRGLEQKWKSSMAWTDRSSAEKDRLRFRATCRRSNWLINESQNKH